MQEAYEYRANSLDAIASLMYVSNFRFLVTLDYFSIDALSRVLTHYWSLSIEEQFYLLFPFYILLIKRKLAIPKNGCWVVFIGLCVFAF